MTSAQVDDLARVTLSYPTYAGILVCVAAGAARQLGLEVFWQAHQVESTEPGHVPGGAVPSAVNEEDRG